MPFLIAFIAGAIVTTAGVQITSAQTVDPMRALQDAKRERLEMDKRFKREKCSTDVEYPSSTARAGSP